MFNDDLNLNIQKKARKPRVLRTELLSIVAEQPDNQMSMFFTDQDGIEIPTPQQNHEFDGFDGWDLNMLKGFIFKQSLKQIVLGQIDSIDVIDALNWLYRPSSNHPFDAAELASTLGFFIHNIRVATYSKLRPLTRSYVDAVYPNWIDDADENTDSTFWGTTIRNDFDDCPDQILFLE